TGQGSWMTYELRAVWRPDDGVIQLLAFPDIRVVEDKRGVAHEALALINEQLWLGHFELWSNSGTILFRHGMLVGADAGLSLDLTETLIESAIDECERFYPVFQFVLWGGKTPAEALAASLIETRGEAQALPLLELRQSRPQFIRPDRQRLAAPVGDEHRPAIHARRQVSPIALDNQAARRILALFGGDGDEGRIIFLVAALHQQIVRNPSDRT